MNTRTLTSADLFNQNYSNFNSNFLKQTLFSHYNISQLFEKFINYEGLLDLEKLEDPRLFFPNNGMLIEQFFQSSIKKI